MDQLRALLSRHRIKFRGRHCSKHV